MKGIMKKIKNLKKVNQVMVNGDLTEPFPVTNGGKQGD